jgi:hypothetical protein
MTIRLNELRKQEREDLVCVVECLHALAVTRESLIEAEQERSAMLTEDAVKHENAIEQIHAELQDACRGIALGTQGSTIDLLEKLIACTRVLGKLAEDPSANPRHPECEP